MKTKHICFTRNAAFGSVATLLIAAAAFPVPAFADLCRDPEVTINNLKSDPFDMEVRKVKYFDGCDNTWRTEVVPTRFIPANGGSTTYTDDLEYVEGCPIVAFKLYRKVKGSNGAWGALQWGGDLFPNEGTDVLCNTGTEYHLDNH